MSPRRRTYLGDFDVDLWRWAETAVADRRYAIDRMEHDRQLLAANRLEGDTHQAWALTDPAHRDRLVVVYDLAGAPPTVGSMIIEPPG